MQQDNIVSIVFYAAMPFLSLSFLFVAFAPKHRNTSRWLRGVCVLLAIIGPIWTALGFMLLFYSSHFTRHTRVSLGAWMSHLSGIAIGLLISLILSPEFREIARCSSRSNQSLQPTAGPSDA
jgi:membrane associated rhomboid family serine protease